MKTDVISNIFFCLSKLLWRLKIKSSFVVFGLVYEFGINIYEISQWILIKCNYALTPREKTHRGKCDIHYWEIATWHNVPTLYMIINYCLNTCSIIKWFSWYIQLSFLNYWDNIYSKNMVFYHTFYCFRHFNSDEIVVN